MTVLFLVAQLTIIASGLPLKPADAAATLRRASPDLDLSRGLFRLDDLPFVINVSPPTRSRPAPGLVVPRIRAERPDLGFRVPELPGITYSLPCQPGSACSSSTVVVIDRSR
jgi:hypothetical protein